MTWIFRFYRQIALIGFTGILLVAAYSLFLEPNWLEVTHHEVVISGDKTLKAPIKIAHVSDLHTRGLGYRERQLLKILARENPDIIVLTGDNVANIASSGERQGLMALLKELHAPRGVYAVLGNWDNWLRDPLDPLNYKNAKVTLLNNRSHLLDGELEIIGLDDSLSGYPKPKPLLAPPAKGVRLLLFHSPDLFDEIAGSFDLALAGHTHGGQVNLPFFGPPYYPKGSGRFQQGWYEKNGSKMFISRGIGMSVLPVRFRCRPEIAFITLTPSS